MLTVHSLSVKAGNHTILSDISFTVAAGEKVAVLGLSGSGKSTLLESIGSLQTWNPDFETTGRVLFHDEDLLTMTPDNLNLKRGRQFGFIFQEPIACFNPVIRVGEQIISAYRKHHPGTDAVVKELVLDWFEKVKLPSPEKAFNSYPHQLSGGQLQRIMTVFALMHGPELILADEPISALDEENKNVVLTMLENERSKSRSAILMVTHDFSFAKSWADKLIILHDGKVAEEGTPGVLAEKSIHPFTRSLFSFEQKRYDLTALISKAESKDNEDRERLALEVRSLKKSYTSAGNTTTVLKNINLQLAEGDILGIQGPSGCGKSTLARCILRLESIDNGSIRWFYKEVTHLDFDTIRPLRKHVQIVFQDTNLSLPPHMTIREILLEAVYASGYSAEDIDRVLADVGIEKSVKERYPRQLSGGQRQRVCMARALLFRPGLLVLDEVISMLDPVTQLQMVELLLKINKEKKMALLFITHDKDWLRVITKDIMVL